MNPTSESRIPLVSATDVEAELDRLFGSGASSGLVIGVSGEVAHSKSPEALDAFRVMLESLRMFDSRYDSATSQELLVEAPDEKTIAKALIVLAKEEHQKRLLDIVLTTFGRRLIDPLGEMLERAEGSLQNRLRLMRDGFFSEIRDLRLTAETEQILLDDLRKLYSDEYIVMLSDHEEKVQRPKVAKLAQRILRLIGSTFYRALRHWPEHAEQIAHSVARRMSKRVSLKESPVVIRDQISTAIEEFLWVETCTDLEGALFQLFAEHKNVLPVESLTIDRDLYRAFSRACWDIISEYC